MIIYKLTLIGLIYCIMGIRDSKFWRDHRTSRIIQCSDRWALSCWQNDMIESLTTKFSFSPPIFSKIIHWIEFHAIWSISNRRNSIIPFQLASYFSETEYDRFGQMFLLLVTLDLNCIKLLLSHPRCDNFFRIYVGSHFLAKPEVAIVSWKMCGL